MHSRTSNERAGWWLKLAAIAGVMFLHFPLLIIILYAFNSEEASFTFPPPGLTLRWFGELFRRADFWDALGLSLRIALIATGVAIILGTMIALAIYRTRFFGR